MVNELGIAVILELVLYDSKSETDADEDERAWEVDDVCSEDDDDDYAYVASDARYLSSDSFAKDGGIGGVGG